MFTGNIKKIVPLVFVALVFNISCSPKKTMRFTLRPINPNTSIAVIVDSTNNVKNVIIAKFMKKGFRVKAINASDFYTVNDIFDIRDFKRLSHVGQHDSFLSMEKSYNNLYKLHLYNYELNKAEILTEMRTKWNVQYLVILDLKDWEETSWGRVIDLGTQEIIWVENYPTGYRDTLETIVNHFIKSMTRR